MRQVEGETWNPATEILKDKGPLYIFQGDGYQTYSHLDAGSFIWGHYMNVLGFSLQDTKDGALKFNKNDSKADLRSIQNGYLLNRYKGLFPRSTPIKNSGN